MSGSAIIVETIFKSLLGLVDNNITDNYNLNVRSTSEHNIQHQSTMHRELMVLSEVEGYPDITQRELSSRIGMALGLTNLLLRQLTQKGYVRVSQASWKKRIYTLTPSGISRKIRLTLNYVGNVLDDFREVRLTLNKQLEPLGLNKESRIAIFGVGQFAELVYLALREHGIEEIEILSLGPHSGDKFLGLSVRDASDLKSDEFDKIIIATLNDSDGILDFISSHKIPVNRVVEFFGHS